MFECNGSFERLVNLKPGSIVYLEEDGKIILAMLASWDEDKKLYVNLTNWHFDELRNSTWGVYLSEARFKFVLKDENLSFDRSIKNGQIALLADNEAVLTIRSGVSSAYLNLATGEINGNPPDRFCVVSSWNVVQPTQTVGEQLVLLNHSAS